jgi:hypothetical protein
MVDKDNETGLKYVFVQSIKFKFNRVCTHENTYKYIDDTRHKYTPFRCLGF